MGKEVKTAVSSERVKVPVIMQMTAQEGGAACLCMILAYYGKWMSLEEVGNDSDVSKDGSNFSNISMAAEGYGMKTELRTLTAEELLANGPFPCIIRWDRNHYMILNGLHARRISLNDPAKGDYYVSVGNFKEHFAGECLFMEPGEDFEPGGEEKNFWKTAWNKLDGIRWPMLFLAIVTCIVSLTKLFSDTFSRVFLDRLLTGREPEWTVPFLVLLSAVTAIAIIASWIQSIYGLRLEGKIATTGNAKYMWKVLNLPMVFFSQRSAGDIQQRMKTNSEMAKEIIVTLAPLAVNTFMMIFYLVVMFRYSWLLSVIGLISVIVQAWITIWVSRKRVNILRTCLVADDTMHAEITSGIEMIETIKSSGVEKKLFERWAGYIACSSNNYVRYRSLDLTYGTLPDMISKAVNVIIMVLGVWLAFHGMFTAGMILAFKGFLSSFMQPARMLVNAVQRVQQLRSKSERIQDVMEYPEEEVFLPEEECQEDCQMEFTKLTGHLEMKNVSFGYSHLKPALVKDFSLEMKPGQKIAFVGASGCGKSTLTKLLTGLYQPWSGEILFDGKPMREIHEKIFTDSVAIVEQEITIFEDTIVNNIVMWDDTIPSEEIVRACRDAQIHDDIMQREGGYAYRIAEGGKDFSGGQRQRMEIARALVKNPAIMILDEATSALDASTEGAVLQAIADRGITCIMIAHRLSTVRDCDEIIVMDQGVVVERGTHEELMAMDGVYKTLVTSE